MSLVIVRKDKVFSDSLSISKKFRKQHVYLLKIIEGIIEQLDEHDDTIIFTKKSKEYRGRIISYYEMNRAGFSLIAMGFTGKDALPWKIKFIQAFNIMESQLLKIGKNKDNIPWVEQRRQSKSIRKSETDVIKVFVEYATNQGSKSAKFYYKHFTVATHKALGLIQHKNPVIRETLDTMQLFQLGVAENVAQKSIVRYMNQGDHYKVIFEKVKNDLLKLADSMFVGEPTPEIGE